MTRRKSSNNPIKGAPSPATEDEQRRQEHNQRASTVQEDAGSSHISEDDGTGTLTPPSSQDLQDSPDGSDFTVSIAIITTPPSPRASPESSSPRAIDVAPSTTRRQDVENLGPPGSFEQQPLFPERFATGTRGPPPPSGRRPQSRRSIQREMNWWRRSGIEQHIQRRISHATQMGYMTEPPGDPLGPSYYQRFSRRKWRWQDVLRLYNARLMVFTNKNCRISH